MSRVVRPVVAVLVLGGCFVITDEEIRRHNRQIDGNVVDGDADTDTDADTDLADGNDTPDEAEDVPDTLGDNRQCVSSQIDFPGDVDWFRFTGAEAGIPVLVTTIADTANPPLPTDTVLTTEAGATSNDSLFGLNGTDSTLMVAAGAAVGVSEWDAQASGEDRRFQVCGQLAVFGDQEPNDDYTTAVPLGPPSADGSAVAGNWDGTADHYVFTTRSDRVYRVALLPGHGIPGATLTRIDPYTGYRIALTGTPDYDDRPYTLGYPPDAGLMFSDPLGFAFVAIDGVANAAGPYVLAVQELPALMFPFETEPNDSELYAQFIPLLLQPGGVYRADAQGSLYLYDPADWFLLDRTVQGIDWSDLVLDFVVQADSVGSDQDLQVLVLDADTYEQLVYVDSDPNGLLGRDPALFGAPLAGHDRLLFSITNAAPDGAAHPWFGTLTIHP